MRASYVFLALWFIGFMAAFFCQKIEYAFQELDARVQGQAAEIAWLKRTACRLELSTDGRTWHPASLAFPDTERARFWRWKER